MLQHLLTFYSETASTDGLPAGKRSRSESDLSTRPSHSTESLDFVASANGTTAQPLAFELGFPVFPLFPDTTAKMLSGSNDEFNTLPANPFALQTGLLAN